MKKKSVPIVVKKKTVAKAGKPVGKAPVKKEAPTAKKPLAAKAARPAPKTPEKAKPSAKSSAIKVEGKRKLATQVPVKSASAAKPPKDAVKPAPSALAPAKKTDDAVESAKKAKKLPEIERVVEAAAVDEEVVLTDAEGRRYCRMKDCDQAATVDGGYCRYHYLLFWKNIQSRKKILSEGKLERYIEELTARYPDKYLELLRKDLRSEKDFMAAIQELEIDDSGVDNEFEDEAQSYLDEVRGVTGESSNEREEEF